MKYKEGKIALQDELGRGIQNMSQRNRHAQRHGHVKEIMLLIWEEGKMSAGLMGSDQRCRR